MWGEHPPPLQRTINKSFSQSRYSSFAVFFTVKILIGGGRGGSTKGYCFSKCFKTHSRASITAQLAKILYGVKFSTSITPFPTALRTDIHLVKHSHSDSGDPTKDISTKSSGEYIVETQNRMFAPLYRSKCKSTEKLHVVSNVTGGCYTV